MILNDPLVRAALGAILAAVVIDVTAFLNSPDKDTTGFKWRILGFRILLCVATAVGAQLGTAPAAH